MQPIKLKHRLPGYIATGAIILVTAFWAFWGTAEMYYEGWGTPFPQPIAYLIPFAVCLFLTIITLTWPRAGGWLIIVAGSAFTAWWWVLAYGRGWLNLRWILSTFPVSGLLILTGILFLMEGRLRRRLQAEGWTPPEKWWRRNLRYLCGVGAPLVVFIGVTAYHLPILTARVDDGNRGAQLIDGNGVSLVWAPEGPGWNWKQPWGGYPAWDSLALYGLPPIGFDDKPGYENEDRHAASIDMASTGLCRYLSANGLTLMDAPQDIWRMPTVDEFVRSLMLHGENAGCVWSGGSGWLDCDMQPDKETPLWAPDRDPIYYWAADEDGTDQAYYVSYNGSVHSQNKGWGNPRHGYRCVREP